MSRWAASAQGAEQGRPVGGGVHEGGAVAIGRVLLQRDLSTNTLVPRLLGQFSPIDEYDVPDLALAERYFTWGGVGPTLPAD